MKGSPLILNVLGVEIRFQTGTSERIREAVQLLEDRFAAREKRSGGQSKEATLIFLALGLADEFLQTKSELERTHNAIRSILEKIEKSE